MAGSELNLVVGGVAPLVDRLARFGFAIKGVVTILVGALALRYALGWGGDVPAPVVLSSLFFGSRSAKSFSPCSPRD